MAWGIAAVGEPAGGVAGRDGGEGAPGGGAKAVVGPCLSTAKRLLDLGKGLLDRIEVGGIGRERQEAGATPEAPSAVRDGPVRSVLAGAATITTRAG